MEFPNSDRKRTMRIVSAFSLAVMIGLALGCGGKPDAPPADSKQEPSPSPTPGVTPTPPANPDTNTPAIPPTSIPATWELDPAKHIVPAGAVTGKVRGEAVTLNVQAEKDSLRFIMNKGGQAVTVVEIHLSDPEKSTEGLSAVVKPDQKPGLDVPNVIVRNPANVTEEPKIHKNEYALTLNLGKRDKGKLDGKIYLSLKDDQKSYIAGTFTADWIRPTTELPGPDDAPFIHGKLTITGATDPNVWFGFVRVEPHDPAMPTAIDVIGTELKPGASSVRTDNLRPLALLVPGANGLKDPARYELTKLEPGRYWVFATVKGGPAAWKWVDVTPSTQLAFDFAIDATKFGSLDVAAPGTAEFVAVLPAPEAGKPWPEGVVSSAASIVDLYVNTAANKPDPAKPLMLKFPRLAPGKYEVWSGDSKVDVEIKLNETAKVELNKK
jgi:hypothetical protein